MIRGQNIICFGSSTWEYPGLQQTVMRLLSRDNRILYVNAIGTRKIALSYSQLSFYLKRTCRLFQHDQRASKNIMVCNPWIIPLVYSDITTKINRTLLRRQFSRLLSILNFTNYILWVGTPSAASFVDLFKPALFIYNPVDRYYAFPFVNSVKTRNYERQIAANSDVILCTAEAIKEDLLPYNEYSFTVTHGVDFNHFHSALSGSNVPEDIKDIPKPIIGYFGGLSDRVNYGLLNKIAIRYPNANIVLIGKKLLDLGKFEKLPNVHTLGYRDFSVLPHYLKQFSVCLIPYHVNELMEGVDPIKLREYLCLGKAVVSVDLPEVRKLEGLVYIGKNEEDYIVKVGKAMEKNSASLIEERIRAAKQSDWPVKIEQISNIVFDAFDRKKSSKDMAGVK